MTPNEILFIRNQMIKDIKSNNNELVIADSLSYQLDNYSFALEASITNGNLELVKHFLGLGATIQKKECLKDVYIKAKCVDILKTIQEKHDIKEDTLQQIIFAKSFRLDKPKPKVLTFLINHFLDVGHKDTAIFVNKHFNNDKEEDIMKLLIPLLVPKLSSEELDICIERASRHENPLKSKLLFNAKLESHLEQNSTVIARNKI